MTDNDTIRQALAHIPAHNRETWLNMGMAVHSELGDAGFDLWDAWSAQDDSYNPKATKSVWKGFKPGGGIGIGTLFHEAQQHGFQFDGTGQRQAPDPAKLAERQRRQQEAEVARQAKADETAKQSVVFWGTAKPCLTHVYTREKKVKPELARVLQAADCKGWFWTTNDDGELVRLTGTLLTLPLYNIGGELRGLQAIDEAGRKSLIKGLGKQGLFIPLTGGKLLADYTGKLYIEEGFSTAATVKKATEAPTVAAIDAGNLIHVARAWRLKLPLAEIIICGDLDKSGTGQKKAHEAALAVGGMVALPPFTDEELVGDNPPSDWNDYAALHGNHMVTVKCAIAAELEAGKVVALPEPESATTGESDQLSGTEAPKQDADCAMLESGVTGVTEVQANNDGLPVVTPEENHEVTEVTPEPIIPDESKRPCFKVFDEWTPLPDGGKLKPGVWFFTTKPGKDGAPSALIQQWICSPLHLEAVTADGQNNNFGRLLRFKNTHGQWREWAMPMELLRGAGDELRGELLAMGAEIDPQAGRSLLAQYLQSKPPKRRIHCATQVGWCGESFVMPDTVIGAAASGVVFQSGERGHDEFTKAGSMAGWQAEISARAVGNPLLVLALSASFTGAMLSRCNGESGGIHFVGDSSTGKTTLLEAGCATWGGAGYRRSWRATSNGMEGAASLFNDGLLALDEISECDPREVGAIIYALGNGRGKQRASRAGGARGVTRWRCFVLSSGERTISTAMAEGGAKAKAGQSVRLLDVPAARRFGAWDNLHDLPSGTAFSDAIKRASVTHHGHAGRAFLEKLTRDRRDFCAFLERFKALPAFSADGGEGQDKRAAARFALIALAGEVATEYGITGWPEGDALKAAAEGFKAWRSLRGRGNDERRQITGQVVAFIERHGDSRFSNADANEADAIRINRAGWWRDDGSGVRVYLFTSEGMREAVKGFDIKRALDILQESGALLSAGSERIKSYRIGGRVCRLYPVNTEKLTEGNHA